MNLKKKRLVLEKFILEQLQDIKTSSEGVDNVLRGILKNECKNH